MTRNMNWSKRDKELGLPSPHGWLGVLRTAARALTHLNHESLRALSQMRLASDAGRRSVAVTKANLEEWRAQAYQAYWRTQAR